MDKVTKSPVDEAVHKFLRAVTAEQLSGTEAVRIDGLGPDCPWGYAFPTPRAGGGYLTVVLATGNVRWARVLKVRAPAPAEGDRPAVEGNDYVVIDQYQCPVL